MRGRSGWLRPPQDPFRLLVLAGMVLYVLVFASLAFDLHTGMRTHKSDLGQMDQAIWNTSRGRFVENMQDETLATRMTDHVEPIFLLISPVFWLWDDVRALLLVQVLAAALGVWPLYELARSKVGRGPALALAWAYLLDPHLQSAILTEFHAIPLAVPLILWAFRAIEARNWRQFVAAALLVAAVKEEAALLAAGLGVWAWWRQRGAGRRWQVVPLAILAISLVWFSLATFVIVPAHALPVHGSAESAYFQRYGALGDSPLDIFTSFFTQPGVVWQIATEPARVNYLWGLLTAFGFLGLFAPEVILLSLPVLLANLLSAYPAQYYGEFHYSAPLIPYFAVAAVHGMSRINGWLKAAVAASRAAVAASRRERSRDQQTEQQWERGAAIAVVGVLLISSSVFYVKFGRGPLGGRYDPTPITAHHRLLPQLAAQIPAEAAVTATAAVHPHLSHRRFIYQFPLGLHAAVPAEWALLDVTTNTDMAPGDLHTTVMAMLAGDWGVVDANDGFLLLRRGERQKQIPESFYRFVRTTGGAQGEALLFTGLELTDWPRWRQTKVTTRWQVGAAYQPGALRPWLELRTPAGERVYTFDDLAPPALVWLPPDAWQPGDEITIETLALSLPRAWGAMVGVVHGPNPAAAGDRLPAEKFLAAPALALSEERTLALAGVFMREQNQGRVKALPTGMFPGRPAGVAGSVSAPLGASISFQTWLGAEPPRPGGFVSVGIAWDAPLPAGYIPFVHLRQGNVTITQADGPPRRFGLLTAQEVLLDWRTLPIPADLPPQTRLDIFLGVYNPDTGQRLEVAAPSHQLIGNEILRHTLRVAPPATPDQACALIPATCASQP